MGDLALEVSITNKELYLTFLLFGKKPKANAVVKIAAIDLMYHARPR